MSFIPFLVDGGTQQVAGSAGFLGTILPFLLIIVIFYFFLIRPQNKKQKEILYCSGHSSEVPMLYTVTGQSAWKEAHPFHSGQCRP